MQAAVVGIGAGVDAEAERARRLALGRRVVAVIRDVAVLQRRAVCVAQYADHAPRPGDAEVPDRDVGGGKPDREETVRMVGDDRRLAARPVSAERQALLGDVDVGRVVDAVMRQDGVVGVRPGWRR